MSGIYTPGTLPRVYDQAVLMEEFRKIADFLAAFQVPYVILVPQAVEPAKRFEGLVANADGTNWNPGSGAGLYEYKGGSWSKL